MKRVVYLFCFVLGALGISQTPELFYEDGGDLGALIIRDDTLYYMDNGIGLKGIQISSPVDANLIVSTTINNIENIFWGIDGEMVYFNAITIWYQSEFDPLIINEATFYTDFNSQYVWDIKQDNNKYYMSFSDIGTSLFSLQNIDPIQGCQQFGGFFDGFVKNINANSSKLFISDLPNNDSTTDNSGLFQGNLNDFESTKEFLFDFGEPISQIEANDDYVYVALKESNSIAIFQSNQPAPWTPLKIIELDNTQYTLEKIAIYQNDIYFTDSLLGNIYILDEETTLSVTDSDTRRLSLFPNPSSHFVNINLNTRTQIIITDLNGRILEENIYNAGKQIIDVSYFVSGIYFMNFLQKDKTTIRRFIKQ